MVNELYQKEYARLQTAIIQFDLPVIQEYVKRVKTGGKS
jgi:hypothetical protein